MIEVRFAVASAEELQAQLNRIAAMVSGVQMLPQSEAPPLALFTSEELHEELQSRQAADDARRQSPEPAAATALAAAEPEKRKPGRPSKLKAVAPPPTPAPEPQPDPANPFEPEPQPAAVAAAKPEVPSQQAGTLTQNVPTVEQMMKLMTQLYGKCKDILLVRSIAEEVCGKVNLADCPPDKFPALKAKLEAKLAEYDAPKGAVA